MIDQTTRNVLEIDALLERIAEQAQCSLGARHVRELAPLHDVAAVERRLKLAGELLLLLDTGRRVPLAGIEDLGDLISITRVRGSLLERDQWPRLVRVIRASEDLQRFARTNSEEFPTLSSLIARLNDHSELLAAIGRVFDADGLVRDQASPELARLRAHLRRTEDALRRQLEAVRSRLRGTDILQDEYSTLRNGRHVFPVRASYRRKLNGIVHGSSNSGETIFIEPLEVVEAANDVELAREAEHEEVQRILLELTGLLREHIATVEEDQVTLARIDGAMAIARLASRQRWKIPMVVQRGALRLFDAHHPMLHLSPEVESVPITVCLEPGDRVIVLSGPNAGGKTTMMKTVALMVILVQCGVPVPASPDSRLPLYDGFHADIGDSQDLGEGISTFSGHVRRLKEIMRVVGSNALLLLDELGTGTDPDEGGALAVALLEEFGSRAALTLATSHFGPVKQWAEETPTVRNASFSLDPGTMRPAFRLRLDLPGASEALVIADNEGLPRGVLKRARDLVGEQKLQMGVLLQRIEERERKLAETLREAEARAESLESQERIAKQRAEELREERRRVREAALAERETAGRELRERIEKMIANLPSEDQLRARKEGLNTARAMIHGEQRMTLAERIAMEREANASPALGSLRVGKKVYVRAFGNWGEIVRLDADREKALVRVGGLNVELAVEGLSAEAPPPRAIPARDATEGASADSAKKKKAKKSKKIKAALEVLPKAKEARPAGNRPASSYLAKPSQTFQRDSVSMELDLHGYRVEEALAALDKYLDRALMADYPYVRIIHGTGQGRLYRAVHDFLRTYPSITRYRFGTTEEGGGGVTIVEF